MFATLQRLILCRHDLHPAQRIARGITSNEERSGRCPFNFTIDATVRGYAYGPRRLDLTNRFCLTVSRRQHAAAQRIRSSRGIDNGGFALLLEAARACPSLTELVLHRNAIADAGALALAAHVRGWPGLVDVDLGRNDIGDRRAAQRGVCCRQGARSSRMDAEQPGRLRRRMLRAQAGANICGWRAGQAQK